MEFLVWFFSWLHLMAIHFCQTDFYSWIKTMSVQTNELYQLASVAFCLLVAWVCPYPYFSHAWISVFLFVMLYFSYVLTKQKKWFYIVPLLYFTLFSNSLGCNLHTPVCVCKLVVLCFSIFMFKIPFAPFLWHELHIYVTHFLHIFK